MLNKPISNNGAFKDEVRILSFAVAVENGQLGCLLIAVRPALNKVIVKVRVDIECSEGVSAALLVK